MAIEKQNIESSFDEFINQYKSDKMSVLVGAGLSMNVSDKFLSWRVLVKDMVEYVYKDKIELHCENYIHIHGNKTNIEDIKSLYIETILDNEDFLQLASKYIRKKGYREAMEYYIEERTPKLDFSSENNEIELNTIKGTVGTIFESDLSVHKALLGCRRFQNIYTTNYDNIIEFTSELLKNEDSKLPYNLVTSGMDLSGNLCHNIIKIHGSISYDNKFQFDGDSHLRYIIAKEDYDTYMEKHEAFSYLMRIAMLQGVFCLVGFSGTDPNYLTWVRWMSDILNAGSCNKIYLIDIDGKEIFDDLKSFYSNHHIVVINLWTENILSHIFKDFRDSELEKGIINNEEYQKANNNIISVLIEKKKQFDEADNNKKNLLKPIIIKYKKLILENFFKYLQCSDKEKNSLSYFNKGGEITTNIENNNINTETKAVKSNEQSFKLAESKAKYFDYRNIWISIGGLLEDKNDLSEVIKKLHELKSVCRFSRIIFPQENVINRLMNKELLTREKAYLFALAVSDIGQLPSYYINYHKDDIELNKQPIWIKLKEREKTLCGTNEIINDISNDWGIYEQIQRYLFHLNFDEAKKLIENWSAEGYWVQAKVMRMAVYTEHKKDAITLLDKIINDDISVH